MLVRALTSSGGGSSNGYAEIVNDFQMKTNYQVNCGFMPNYVRVKFTSSTLGIVLYDYFNGSQYEMYANSGYRTTSKITLTQSSGGFTININDTGYGTITDTLIMCAVI